MKLTTLAAAFDLAIYAHVGHSHPTATSVVHAKRDHVPTGWTKLGRANPQSLLELRIGLTQANVADAERLMNEISDSTSDNYRKFLSPQQVAQLFVPSKESMVDTVSWLVSHDIDSRKIKPSAGRNWINVQTTVAAAEKLLDTTYYSYKNDEEGIQLVACEAYSVPEPIQKHIDLITPTIEFETRQLKPVDALARRDGMAPKIRSLDVAPDPEFLGNCSEATTPACLRALYNIPKEGESVEGNSYGIVEFAPQSYNQTDLNGFFATYTTNIPNNTSPIVRKIDGGYISDADDVDTRGESNLDLCYAMGLVYPQNVTLYQTGDNAPANPATNNNFLDAIDGSYCTFEGGDDPVWDAVYPHHSEWLGNQWENPPQCGTENATHVISFSYGSNEIDRPDAYRQRECTEYMKLGLMGVSVMFSSGDTGVSGLRGICTKPDGTPSRPGATSGTFIPTFPASCPWVTAVGGTGLPKNSTVADKEVVAYTFNPGGGFSTKFPLPSWQRDAVKGYYARFDPGYNSSRYNNSQEVRGFPDIALMSQDYITGLSGGFQAFSGTSASAPTFGAMVTLINGDRIKAGKGPVGFLNPILYSHPEIFNDVVEGNNLGCGTQGFKAVEGWDPVSGLGTPDFVRLKKVLLDLP